jgi:hypothetical protein
VAGSDGNTQTLSISAYAYTYSAFGQASYAQEDLKGIFPEWLNDHPKPAAALQGKTTTTTTTTSGLVCAPSFSAFVYPIPGNGLAWILGLPLFYSYEVEYSNAGAGTIAFTEKQGGCQSCEGVSSMSVPSVRTERQRGVKGMMPHLRTKPSRAIRVNMSQPL